MLLAININNTETKVGLFRGDSLEAHWRLTTTPSRTPDEWAQALTSYLTQAGRSTQEVRAAILASVVPPVTQTLCEAVERATTVKPLVVDGRSRLPITLDVRSEEHTSELQSLAYLVCRLLLEKKRTLENLAQLFVGPGGWAYLPRPQTDAPRADSQAFEFAGLNNSH